MSYEDAKWDEMNAIRYKEWESCPKCKSENISVYRARFCVKNKVKEIETEMICNSCGHRERRISEV